MSLQVDTWQATTNRHIQTIKRLSTMGPRER